MTDATKDPAHISRDGTLTRTLMHGSVVRESHHIVTAKAIDGHLRVVLFDGREGSPTHGQVDVHHVAGARPQLLVIPPDVWHGVQNLGAGPACFVNPSDVAYDHADPDEFRLPADTAGIPYRFVA